MIVLEQLPEALEFANRLLGVKFTADTARWISAVDSDGRLMGVVILTRFTSSNCEMSIVSVNRRFISKALIRALYQYCFVDLGLRRVTCIVDSSNSRSLDVCRRLGFIEEARLQNLYGDNDGIVFRMKREEFNLLRT